MSDMHIVPTNDLLVHVERPDCWCQPQVTAICPECEHVPDTVDRDCWFCHGSGMVGLEHAPGARLVVLHREIADEGGRNG